MEAAPPQRPDPHALLALFPNVLLEAAWQEDLLKLKARPTGLVELCQHLRDDPLLDFNYLADLTAADCPELRVVYTLHSFSRRHFCLLSVPVDRV